MAADRTKFETENFTFHLVSVEEDWKNTSRKTRVSAPSPDMSDIPTPPYGSVHGDGSADDKAWKAYNREELKRMRAALAEAAEELTLQPLTAGDPHDSDIAMVIEALNDKLSFSRTAGCSCGCSPAFISGHRYLMWTPRSYNPKYTRPVDYIFVDRKTVAAEPERTFTFADFAEAQS